MASNSRHRGCHRRRECAARAAAGEIAGFPLTRSAELRPTAGEANGEDCPACPRGGLDRPFQHQSPFTSARPIPIPLGPVDAECTCEIISTSSAALSAGVPGPALSHHLSRRSAPRARCAPGSVVLADWSTQGDSACDMATDRHPVHDVGKQVDGEFVRFCSIIGCSLTSIHHHDAARGSRRSSNAPA